MFLVLYEYFQMQNVNEYESKNMEVCNANMGEYKRTNSTISKSQEASHSMN